MPVLAIGEFALVAAQVVAIGTAAFGVYLLGWGMKRVRSAI
jgi:hypothetical protein